MSPNGTTVLSITKAELQSVDALCAFGSAEYRMRHNERYHSWSDERRVHYALGKAFDAVIAARKGKRAHPAMLDMTEQALKRRSR